MPIYPWSVEEETDFHDSHRCAEERGIRLTLLGFLFCPVFNCGQ